VSAELNEIVQYCALSYILPGPKFKKRKVGFMGKGYPPGYLE
jgi:hypothetical protein